MDTVVKQQHLQWKFPLTPKLKDGNNYSGQEKGTLKYVRGTQYKEDKP